MDYPAKIILFGEYGILLNSKALAIPFPRFSGKFSFPDHSKNAGFIMAEESNVALQKLHTFLKAKNVNFQFLNIQQFEQDIENGLYFDSTIPLGSGLGSSGALTAALYDRYVNSSDSNDFQTIKKYLIAIEACFHGVSSGIDPIISWIKRPLLWENQNSQNSDIDISPFFKEYTLFLINSHSQGNTGTLVKHFMEHYSQSDFKEKIDSEYIPTINQTIDALIEADFSTFENLLGKYSQFQISYFQQMIPVNMVDYFKYGTDTGNFHLKICGSGGGGYILGITRNRKKTETYFNLNHLDYTIV